MKYLKLFEDIDPFGEEDWDEEEVVYVPPTLVITKNNKGSFLPIVEYKEKIYVMSRDNGFLFRSCYTDNGVEILMAEIDGIIRSDFRDDEIDDIKNDEIPILDVFIREEGWYYSVLLDIFGEEYTKFYPDIF